MCDCGWLSMCHRVYYTNVCLASPCSTHRTVQQYNVVQEFNAVLSGHLTDETAFRASDVYSAGGVYQCSPPLSTAESTPTHTEYTEGSPSFTASSLSCSSDAHFGMPMMLTLRCLLAARPDSVECWIYSLQLIVGVEGVVCLSGACG